eukprot:6339525-Amphidinium_carterae.1
MQKLHGQCPNVRWGTVVRPCFSSIVGIETANNMNHEQLVVSPHSKFLSSPGVPLSAGFLSPPIFLQRGANK